MTVESWKRGDVVLGLYEVLDVLDGGGMGLVHRVRHREWNTDLAIKVPRSELAATAAQRARFEDEAGTWVGLGLHPNVVNCLYVRRVEDHPCVFAEWVDGGSLAELVRSGRLYHADGCDGAGTGFPVRALDLAVQTAWGIHHAHEQGVIHQDVKPANVMVDTDTWTAKVTDFGLAGARAAAGEAAYAVGPTEVSLAASYGGMTPAYCSPEQAEAAAGARVTLTRATDVWSWALSVLEMFVGDVPCERGQSAPEVFAAFLEGLRAGPGPGPQAMPSALVDLLWRCFEVDPAVRPHRLDEVAAQLADIYADVAGEPYPNAAPQAAALLADGLSNQALSLLDLDRSDEAEALWRRASNVDPHHPSTVYNWAVYRWREGRLSDEQVLAKLRTARGIEGSRWQSDHLLGLVHVERGDDDTARELLEGAPAVPEVEAARCELAGRRRLPEPARVVGHQDSVTALAVDATGGTAVSGGADGRALVWDPGQNRIRYELTQDAGAEDAEAAPVTAVAVSADGRTVLVAREAGPVEVWDLAGPGLQPRLVRVLTGHTASVTAVAATDSGHAVAARADGSFDVWDTRTGRVRARLTHPPESFQRLDPATDRILPEIHYRPSAVDVVGITGDGGVVVTAAPRDGSVVVWDVAEGRSLHRLVKSEDFHGTGIHTVALSPGSEQALLAGEPPVHLSVWQTRTDQILSTVPNRSRFRGAVALSGNAAFAVSVEDGSHPALRVWETGSGRCLRTADTRLDGLIAYQPRHVTLSADGRVVVIGDVYGGLHFYPLHPPGFRAGWSYARPRNARAQDDSEKRFLQLVGIAAELSTKGDVVGAAARLRAARAVSGFERHPGLRALWDRLGNSSGLRTDLLGAWDRYELRGGTWTFTQNPTLAASSDGELLVTGGADCLVRVWELQTGQQLHTFPEQAGQAHTVLLCEEGGLAVTADWSETAHVWDLTTGKRAFELFGDHGRVRSVSVDRAGQHALVGDADGALCLWNLRTRRRIRTMLAHEGPVTAVRLSPDGKYAASACSHDRTGRLWQTATGSPLLDFSSALGDTVLRFTPDGTRLFVNTGQGVSVWDIRTRRKLYERESAYHATLVLSADGGRAATHTLGVQVWDTTTGTTLAELPERTNMFDISPDGRYVVTGGYDRKIRLWEAATGRCVHTLEANPESLAQVFFTADGRNVVSADLRPAIHLWELEWDYDFTAGAAAEAEGR
ncbi:serine/threonine protein kinase [Streptomyces sp. CEV 2-1]|uniref:protein kinase domain-containing protein n=1 Tax=Streptomyces sp. CEV 2-1 TaxID=2485153 RepID=UPI000F498496|nr:protein kinase [Streptomyces sp. CEV 2-1]ROQ78284.1 serine/threonine protein kinase [Streptomyces sp. CEV 2-1]